MFAKALTLAAAALVVWAVARPPARRARRQDHVPGEAVRHALDDRLGALRRRRSRDGVWQIEHANHLATPTIRPGEVLVLP